LKPLKRGEWRKESDGYMYRRINGTYYRTTSKVLLKQVMENDQ